ncbi:hypothetical protein BDR05DRAFT_482791 [Suillus weaverae]|nr:hypothetical protein BDR05DRAFT_482791 [Suillus weaverae]
MFKSCCSQVLLHLVEPESFVILSALQSLSQHIILSTPAKSPSAPSQSTAYYRLAQNNQFIINVGCEHSSTAYLHQARRRVFTSSNHSSHLTSSILSHPLRKLVRPFLTALTWTCELCRQCKIVSQKMVAMEGFLRTR